MIKLKILTIFLLSPILLLAEPVTISGAFSNCGIKTISISIEKSFLTKDKSISKIKIKNNEFTYTFDLDRNRIVNLNSDEFDIALYIEPGDDLHIDFDPSAQNALQFSGKAAANNNVYNKFRVTFKDQYDNEAIKEKIKTTSLDPFEIQAYDQRRDQKKLIIEHASYPSTSPKFKEFIDQTLRFQYYNRLLAYPIVRGNSNKDPKVVALPRVIADEVESLEVNNSGAIISEAYRSFLLYYATYFTSKTNDYKKFTDYSISLRQKTDYVNHNLTDDAQYYMIAKFTYDICENAGAGLITKNYLQLKKNDKYKHYADAIAAKCGDIMNNPSKDESIKVVTKSQTKSGGLNFSFKGLDGNLINLNDFKGKVVYVDFWASWCGPCRVQFPYSHKLQDRFSEKQKKSIVFLYISIDASEDRWKSAVRSNKLEGVQGISPGNWNSEAVRKFGISGIPRYMIIGKDGKIAESKSQPPSSPVVYDKLIKLIER